MSLHGHHVEAGGEVEGGVQTRGGPDVEDQAFDYYYL